MVMMMSRGLWRGAFALLVAVMLVGGGTAARAEKTVLLVPSGQDNLMGCSPW